MKCELHVALNMNKNIAPRVLLPFGLNTMTLMEIYNLPKASNGAHVVIAARYRCRQSFVDSWFL